MPLLIRAGKCLPLTPTEVDIRFHRPPYDVSGQLLGVEAPQTPNGLRFRIRPDTRTTLILTGKKPGPGLLPQTQELIFAEEPGSAMRPHDRLIGAALDGNRLDFARQDAVDATWRVVEPVLGDRVPMHWYQPGTWGPREAERLLADENTWHNPADT